MLAVEVTPKCTAQEQFGLDLHHHQSFESSAPPSSACHLIYVKSKHRLIDVIVEFVIREHSQECLYRIARIGLEINFSSVCSETRVHLHFERLSLVPSVGHRLTHQYITLLEVASSPALLIEYAWPGWGIKGSKFSR